MTLVLLPDAEQITSRYLRSRSSLTGQRIYTEIPNVPTFPLTVITRIGGAPVFSRPLYYDRALLQISTFGGAKKTTQTIAETIRQELASDDFVGVALDDNDDPLGVVVGCEFGAFRWLPDGTYDPAKPRYIFDVAVGIHAQRVTGS